MEEKKRKTGIDIIGDVPWGTHFCQFYQTKEDLIDILVPYFKTGLENNEFCMWVTSEPLGEKEAREAMQKAVSDLDKYLKKGQIEIVPYTKWYLKDGVFNLQRVLNAWIDKLNQALAKGYDGLRVTGNTAWLEKREWENFTRYEEEVNNAIGKYQMIAICTYSLDKCGASEVIDVVKNHQFALIKREGKWKLIESSESKKVEEELRASESKYKTLLENLPQKIFFKDKNSVYVSCNENYARDLKIKPNMITGKTDYDFYPKSLAEKYIADDRRIVQTKETEDFEEEYLQEGQAVFVHTVKTPVIDEKGNIIGVLGVFWDITERKKLQEQLIQSEKLAAVGTLAYGIAHEFNNILAGMLANAELGLITQDSRQIKECFEIIADNSHRAASITNNLLAFARQKEARKELIDITEPLRSVLTVTRRDLEKLNLEIVEKFKPVPKIYCDAGQLSEVFLNMITNARDAMREKGGKLTIQVERVGENIQIIFEDTGCGIPEKLKGKIFEPFVTTKGALGGSEIPGTGLGLFLSYGIIDGYQGKIEVESEAGKGVKFTILIPVSKNLPPKAIKEIVIKSSIEIERRLKILLVDDEKAISSGLKKFLESRGHQVTASLKAEEGLEHFEKEKFDLVLSDITMPGMDGIELIKKIKEQDQKTKVIVITGHIMREMEEKAKEAGADEVLIKPFKNDVLCLAISKLI